jgi:hypothetical protein
LRRGPATTFFRRSGWRWCLTFGLIGAGRCDLALGDRDRGLERLYEARDLAKQMGAAPLLADIDAAWAEVASATNRRPTSLRTSAPGVASASIVMSSPSAAAVDPCPDRRRCR